MLSRLAFLALIPAIGMAGGYFGATSIMVPAAASQPAEGAPLHKEQNSVISFTEKNVGERAAVSEQVEKAPSKSLDEALGDLDVFANPEKAEDERLAGVLKLGRFSAQVGQGRDSTVLVADVALDFGNRAIAAELWNKTALVELRDTILTSLLSAAELPEVRKAGFTGETLKKEMLLQLQTEVPGITDLHLIKISTRHSSIESPLNGIDIALR